MIIVQYFSSCSEKFGLRDKDFLWVGKPSTKPYIIVRICLVAKALRNPFPLFNYCRDFIVSQSEDIEGKLLLDITP